MNLVTKLSEYKFDYHLIREDVLRLLSQNNFTNQIGLTHSNKELNETEKLFESIGSAYDVDGSIKFRETDFTIFNEAYRDTYLYEIYKAIPSLGRFRIMNLEGPRCYTIHRDQTKRYHYVIETNPDCLFLFPGLRQQVHIPQDENLYLVDTRYRHTFVNGSRKRRIHIVIDDLSSL